MSVPNVEHCGVQLEVHPQVASSRLSVACVDASWDRGGDGTASTSCLMEDRRSIPMKRMLCNFNERVVSLCVPCCLMK